MKTLIVGAGALGGIIGARLLAAGASVYRGHFRETVYVWKRPLCSLRKLIGWVVERGEGTDGRS